MPSQHVESPIRARATAVLDRKPPVESARENIKMVAYCSLVAGVFYLLGALAAALELIGNFSPIEFLIVALPFLALYGGLTRLWPAARWAAIGLAGLLIFIPFSWYVLWAFTRPATKEVFANRRDR